MAKKKVDFNIELRRLTKNYFWLPQQLKANLLTKLHSEGIGLQKFLSGLVILYLEGNEDIRNAVQKIVVSVHDKKESKNLQEIYAISSARRIARKGVFMPMSEEELADFFDFTEQELEKELFEDED